MRNHGFVPPSMRRPLEMSHVFPISTRTSTRFIWSSSALLLEFWAGFLAWAWKFYCRSGAAPDGVDWNYAVGTTLATLLASRSSRQEKHRTLGNVDLKLGMIWHWAPSPAPEGGAQLIQALKRAGT